MFCYISVTIPDTVVKNNHNYLLVVKFFNTDNPDNRDRGAIFGLRGPNAELPRGGKRAGAVSSLG